MSKRLLYRDRSAAHYNAEKKRKSSGRIYGEYGRGSKYSTFKGSSRFERFVDTDPGIALGNAARTARKKHGAKRIALGAVAAIVAIAVVGAGVSALGSLLKSSSDADERTASRPVGKIVMSLLGDEETVVVKGEDYLEPGCQAIDTVDGVITSSVKSSGTVDTSTTGSYQVTYTVSNSSGAEQSVVRTVEVVDSVDEDTTGISVMSYRHVYDADNQPGTLDATYVSSADLESQLKWLSEEEYYFPSFQELESYVSKSHTLQVKSAIITFDVCDQSFFDIAVPLLEKYKVPATCFVICNEEGTLARIKECASPYVTFQSYTNSLFATGQGGEGTARIEDLNESEVKADLVQAQKALGNAAALAWPFGKVTDAAAQAADDAGVLCAFTENEGQAHKGDNPLRLSRYFVQGQDENALDTFKDRVSHT